MAKKASTRTTAKKAGTRRGAKKTVAKKTPAKKAPAAKRGDKLSAIDAAAKVLGEAKEPLSCKEMIETMASKGYWKSPGGQTPDRTLYSAILREMNTKANDARFEKTERGKFSARLARKKPR